MLLAAAVVDFDCWLNNFTYCVEFLLILTVVIVVVFALVSNRSLLVVVVMAS